jgi:hypothetical protein
VIGGCDLLNQLFTKHRNAPGGFDADAGSAAVAREYDDPDATAQLQRFTRLPVEYEHGQTILRRSSIMALAVCTSLVAAV